MIGIKVSVPITCFRKGMAREYLETDIIPPPSTCYGFLLSLAGEKDRGRHLGARVTPVLLSEGERSVVLRTVWRVKKMPIGSPGNTRPDYQQLLTDVRLILWLDSSEEEPREDSASENRTLEERVKTALDPKRRKEIDRFGGLSLGESTHLVNDVSLYYNGKESVCSVTEDEYEPLILRQDPDGLQTWPVWVDHVGAEGTRYVTGTLVPGGLTPPDIVEMPKIQNQ